mmetsp:Transcript_23446/g.39767  ORF Transcript_23446/g.39767 Transcript_23446/m.39767 type:complete len:116 (-) Transcript_23446:1184-1531(-)
MEITVKADKHHNETGSWAEPLIKVASACEKFINCAYVKKQLDEEWKQEIRAQESAVVRVWNRLETGMEVELYRQFLFEENSVEPSLDETHSTVPKTPSLLRGSIPDIPDLQRTDS